MEAAPIRVYRGGERVGKLKGRQPGDEALAQVRALLGPRPAGGWRRDLLIEHLHLLNDAFGGLHKPHLVALARETNVPMAEVYEVASFYHHFEILDDGEAGTPLTVRVCDGLSCEMAGARDLLARLPQLLGGVKVVAAPCIGRCEQAPAALVGQVAVAQATPDALVNAVIEEGMRPAGEQGRAQADAGRVGYDAYRADGGYSLAAAVVNGEEDPLAILAAMEASGLRGLGGAGFPAGRKWRIVREQPAPRLMAVNIDEGEARGSWPSISTRASRARSRTGSTWSAIRTASSRACSSQPRSRAPRRSTSTCATNTMPAG